MVCSARCSISQTHFLMMKGTPSVVLRAAWEKSWPNSCRRPWSFLWPHWMASVSRHFLWQARQHWAGGRRVCEPPAPAASSLKPS